MSSKELISSKVPVPIGREIAARAKSRGVTVSAYVAELLRQHVSGGDLQFRPAKMGLAAASLKTMRRVQRIGARANQANAKGA